MRTNLKLGPFVFVELDAIAGRIGDGPTECR